VTEFGPEWTRLLQAAKRGVEQGSKRVSVREPDDAERKLIIAVTGSYRRTGTGQVSILMEDLAEYLDLAYGITLNDAIHAATGTPPRERKRERAERDAARRRVLAQAEACRHRDEPWFRIWLGRQTGSGAITRLANDGGDLTAVCAVLDALPADGEPLPVFAERVLGDTKALGPSRVRTLILSALAAWADADRPATAEAERELLEWAGLTPDDLASQVLALNLPADGGIVGEWMTGAAASGIPLRLTLHQLRLTDLHCRAERIFVCENPAVLRLAAERFGPDAAPLVCTEGVPSAAVHRLLVTAPDAQLLWRNDFDWTGVRLTGAALRRYPNARPWRMSEADYSAAIPGIALSGSRTLTPWDPELSDAMARKGRAVMEESMLDVLLDDIVAS
jgi:uncharacterized protein (TIGR02679 family)